MSKKIIQLGEIAYARSGDKGDICNIGLIAKSKDYYNLIKEKVTPERVKELFGNWVKGEVKRYEAPGVNGFEFVLYQALDGGATATLRLDVTGKAFATALLRLDIEVEE